MKKVAMLLGAILAICSVSMAQAKDEKKTISQVLDGNVKTIEGEFISAAEAMPDDKFNYAPTSGEFKGVRTFAQQVKHVAAANYWMASIILGEKPPVDLNDGKGPDSLKSKAEIVGFAKDSYVYVHKALATITDENALTEVPSPFGKGKVTKLWLGTFFPWHGFDHYGQMAVYLRSNGIVPPASRGSN